MTSPPIVGPDWPGAGALVTDTRAPALNLDECVGQRQATFRFELTDAISGENLGEIHPIREASLSHDTASTTKRRLSLSLGVADTAAVNGLTDRVSPFMILPGITNPDHPSGDWPLGRYMWADNPRKFTSAGHLAQPELTDEMFLVDQQILTGISGVGRGVIVIRVLAAGAAAATPQRVRNAGDPGGPLAGGGGLDENVERARKLAPLAQDLISLAIIQTYV